MLQNAYLLAKIGADTAENEQHIAENLLKNWRDHGRGDRRRRGRLLRLDRRRAEHAPHQPVRRAARGVLKADDPCLLGVRVSKIGKISNILRHLQIFAEFSQKLLIFQTDFLLKY